jgi:hypothetical protein
MSPAVLNQRGRRSPVNTSDHQPLRKVHSRNAVIEIRLQTIISCVTNCPAADKESGQVKIDLSQIVPNTNDYASLTAFPILPIHVCYNLQIPLALVQYFGNSNINLASDILKLYCPGF